MVCMWSVCGVSCFGYCCMKVIMSDEDNIRVDVNTQTQYVREENILLKIFSYSLVSSHSCFSLFHVSVVTTYAPIE